MSNCTGCNDTYATALRNEGFGQAFYCALGACTAVTLAFLVCCSLWYRKYRSLVNTIHDLQGSRSTVKIRARQDSPVLGFEPMFPSRDAPPEVLSRERDAEHAPLQQSFRLPWKPLQPSPRFTKSDLSLQQLIKAGKEGVFYKARMTRGTCKGHALFTCKISKEGVSPKTVDSEVSTMRKLLHHKNILQILDWNTSSEPYILIMEYVSYGTLRSFLQSNRDRLTADPEHQSLFTIASYHIALAMEHMRSKMIVHCDLALRNIMVSTFPWEVKVAEFGLARDLTRMRSRRSKQWNSSKTVPLRWYPPEYFRNNYYSFKGDVWAFGILMWEMQTFGTLPYPNLESSAEVIYYICAGHKNAEPEGCRPEILQIMKECWKEPYTARPSFSNIVQTLGDIIENDADYVDVES